MTDASATFTLGIEEEYLLVDRETRDLATDPPPGVMADCKALLGKQVSPEFFRCQIEVGTRVAHSMAEAHADLARLRGTVIDVARDYGLAAVAAGTHPFSDWSLQRHTDKQRYREVAEDLQLAGRRLPTCGLHVHVAIEDETERFDLYNQARYFLPHFLALSTSSPFWRGEPTCMCSYRVSTQREFPRSGIPPTFERAEDYHRAVGLLVSTGLITDGTKIWWDMRPSERYPTLELRITDVCTRMEDSLALAALWWCTLRMLSRLRPQNIRWRPYSEFLLAENVWLAQRFGAQARLLDLGKERMVPLAELVEEWLAMVEEDAVFFGCEREVGHIRRIAAEGTSGDRQMQVYEAALAAGASGEEALRAVVDHLIAETAAGTTKVQRASRGGHDLVGAAARP